MMWHFLLENVTSYINVPHQYKWQCMNLIFELSSAKAHDSFGNTNHTTVYVALFHCLNLF